jgi:hypothetical protein
MRGFIAYSLIVLAAAAASAPPAEAQQRRRIIVEVNASVPVLRVRPRSFLDPGPVVQPGSLDRTTSGYAQTQAYLLSPPYAPNRERFGEGVLPDPITNGPFVGARNPFPPIDFNGPINVHQR